MFAKSHFGVGFLRGLNSVAEVFSTGSERPQVSVLESMRSDWIRIGMDIKTAYNAMFSNTTGELSRSDPANGGEKPTRPVTRLIAARWSGPLPPSAELQRINEIVPGGADRLLCMAEKEQDQRIADAQKEQKHRFEETKRGQYLGWGLAQGAVVTAAVVSLCHGPWQVSVALVGIPVLGAVQALISGGRHWFDQTVFRRF